MVGVWAQHQFWTQILRAAFLVAPFGPQKQSQIHEVYDVHHSKMDLLPVILAEDFKELLHRCPRNCTFSMEFFSPVTSSHLGDHVETVSRYQRRLSKRSRHQRRRQRRRQRRFSKSWWLLHHGNPKLRSRHCGSVGMGDLGFKVVANFESPLSPESVLLRSAKVAQQAMHLGTSRY